MLLRRALVALLSSVPLWACATAASYRVKEGRVNVVSSTGSTKYSHLFYKNEDSSRPAPVPLANLDTFKLYFVLDLEEGGSTPRQISAVFTSLADASKSLIVPLRLRANHRVRYEFDTAQPPSGLFALGSDINVRLLVASPPDAGTPTPLNLDLGTVRLDASLTAKGESETAKLRAAAPAEWHVERYGRQPDVEWTFPAGEKAVPVPFALIGSAVVVGGPWIILLALLSRLQPRLTFDAHGLSLQSSAFLTLLGGFLALSLAYFAGLKIFQALPWLGGLALLSSWVGRNALTERQVKRLGVPKSLKAE